MTILVVNDKSRTLERQVNYIKKKEKGAKVYGFLKSREALSFAEKTKVDKALIEVGMPDIDGLELGKRLLKLNPDLKLVCCNAFEKDIEKWFSPDPLLEEPDSSDMSRKTGDARRVRVQCFGRFEIYIDDVPMKFGCIKSKELIAYLVHNRGTISYNQEIIAALWDDDYCHDSYFKKLRKDLENTFRRYGVEDIIWRQRGGIGIDPEKINCDLYEWEKNIGQYTGDYMLQYAWANVPEYEY